MSGCGCDEQARALEQDAGDTRRRWVLWSVLVINVVLFAGELTAALLGESSALLADSADNLGDVMTYAISLAVVGGALASRARAALVKGWIQILFGLAILVEIARRLVMGFEPVAMIMIIAATLALIGNFVCMMLLMRHRADDINMKSVWLCSRNDVIGNASVIVTAGLIASTQWYWIDLIVGSAMALLFLRTGTGVVSEARAVLRSPEKK